MLILLFISLCFSSEIQTFTFTSQLVIPGKQTEMSFDIYYPDAYFDLPPLEVPVVYCLHGFQSGPQEYNQMGIGVMLDEIINNGEIRPMIVVMPEARHLSMFINNYNNSYQWETMFYEEFIPKVEQKYCGGKRSSGMRAIIGQSMGGYGALYHSFIYKDWYIGGSGITPGAFEVSDIDTICYFHIENDSQFVREFSDTFGCDLTFAEKKCLFDIIRDHEKGYFNGSAYRISVGEMKDLPIIQEAVDRVIVHRINSLDKTMTKYGIDHVYYKENYTHTGENIIEQVKLSLIMMDPYFHVKAVEPTKKKFKKF